MAIGKPLTPFYQTPAILTDWISTVGLGFGTPPCTQAVAIASLILCDYNNDRIPCP